MPSKRFLLKLLQMSSSCRDVSRRRSCSTRQQLVLYVTILLAAALTSPATSAIVDEGVGDSARGSTIAVSGSAVSAGDSSTRTSELAAGASIALTAGGVTASGLTTTSVGGLANPVATTAGLTLPAGTGVSAGATLSRAGATSTAASALTRGESTTTSVQSGALAGGSTTTAGGGATGKGGSATGTAAGGFATGVFAADAGGFTTAAATGSVTAAVAGTSGGAHSATAGPKPADLSSCPGLRIGIINGVLYHYEVLAGLMHIFRPYARRTDIYINRYTRSASGDGAWDILRRSRANYVLLTRTILSSLAREKPFYDLLILVSPDYELDANEELLRHIRRRLTVAIVHNSDFNETQRLIRVAESGGSEARLLSLSPHTAATLAEATGRRADWALAVYPFKPQTNCLEATAVDLLGMCLSGFAIQGKFSNQRRNYSAIWSQMLARREDLTTGYAARLFHINILGKGQEERLGVPEDLQSFVTLQRRLPFRGFYDHLHHSFAIVPVLASPRYLTHKFSSSVLSALISGTPLIADARFLASYGMFDEASVYLQRAGETEVDVMLRLVATPAEELLVVRRAMQEARRRMNERATEYFAGLLKELCSKAAGAGGR